MSSASHRPLVDPPPAFTLHHLQFGPCSFPRRNRLQPKAPELHHLRRRDGRVARWRGPPFHPPSGPPQTHRRDLHLDTIPDIARQLIRPITKTITDPTASIRSTSFNRLLRFVLPPPQAGTPFSTTYFPVTSTLPPPTATFEGSGSTRGVDKRVPFPLIIALTVASAIIFVVILLVHLHVRRLRPDDSALGSDSKGLGDPRPRSPSIAVVHSHPGSTESGVLPSPKVWRPSTWRRPSMGGPAQLNSRHVRTPSMLETLRSQTSSLGSVPNNDNDSPPPLPKDVV